VGEARRGGGECDLSGLDPLFGLGAGFGGASSALLSGIERALVRVGSGS